MNDFPPEDEHLRELLEDAVADVEPQHSLDDIRSRTKVTHMSTQRNWLLGTGAAVVATAATITAVVMLGGGTSNTSSPGVAAGPSGTASTTTQASSPTTQPSASTSPSSSADAGPGPLQPVYYAGDTGQGPRLFREFHHEAAADPLTSAVQNAVSGVADDPDYSTLWPTAVQSDTKFDGDLITINLRGNVHDRPAGMTAQDARIALQQLIYTAQGVVQKRAPVQFLLDGKHTDTVLGEPTAEPVSQAPADSTLALVWIIDPAEGATVPSGFTVNGLANAFEANVQWELKQGDTVVRHSFTTAKECCTMAPYSFTLKAPPGHYTLVVHDGDPSGGAGPAPWQDTKDITIAP
jgi:hypothetical protein